MTGTAAHDDMIGAAGNDQIDGEGGDDVLEVLVATSSPVGSATSCPRGDAGADRFVFAHGDGQDRIADFVNGVDHIDLRAIAGLHFADLAITAGSGSGGPGTLIEIDADTSVRLLDRRHTRPRRLPVRFMTQG